MGETEKMDAKISKDKRGRRLKAFDPALLSFFVQLPQKIEHGLKVCHLLITFTQFEDANIC